MFQFYAILFIFGENVGYRK